jgi:hypothetical protein
METAQLTLSLFELHKLIFQHAITNARGTLHIPLFSVQAPGHIGVDSLEVPNINLDLKSLPDHIKSQIVQTFSTSQIGKNYSLESDGIKSGIFDSFLNGIRNTYLLSVVSNPSNRYRAFLHHAENHSRCIAEWLENGTTSRFIQVVIQPEIHINISEFTSFGQWDLYFLSLPERCIEGYQGFQSGQEAAERVFNYSFFRRDMKSMPTSVDDILAEVDILSLSLWQALGNVYRIQDIRFERRPWQFSPDDESLLETKSPILGLWDNPRENLQLQIFVRFNDRKLFPVFSPLTKVYYDRVLKWIDILSANRKAIYSLNMICDGFRDIARSLGEQSFRKHKIARDGIFKTISGLEGLNSECKPLSKNGYKTKATETFIECWSKIWEKALLHDTQNIYLSKASDIKAALQNIYSLRSDLAHSDPTSMQLSLKKTKQSCGVSFNPNQYDPSSVGVIILMVVDEFLEFLSLNDAIFRDMLNGKKPV